jgi:hypothetical protein
MKNGLGTIYAFPIAAREGSLITYGPDYIQIMSLLLAQSGHAAQAGECPLSGEYRTLADLTWEAGVEVKKSAALLTKLLSATQARDH